MAVSRGIARSQYTAGGGGSGGGGGAGTLIGAISLFAQQGSLANLNLSTEGVLDWFATINSTNGAATPSQPAKGGTSLSGFLRKSFYMTGLGSSGGPGAPSGLTEHSDAVDSSGNALAATNGLELGSVGNNPTWLNWGFDIEAPASKTTLRNLNLYICALNGTNGNSVTFKTIANLSDESAAEVAITQVQLDTNQLVFNCYKVNFQFQAGNAGARLRVQCFVTAITGSMQFVILGLQCATLF
jgi:hypothetical protein